MAIFPWSYSSVLNKKCNQQLVRQKWNKSFKQKKKFITCSELVINELGLCPSRLNDVYFANNEQASLAFTDAFCFAHAVYNLIKLILYNNWSAQAVNNISESAMWNSKQTNQIHHL